MGYMGRKVEENIHVFPVKDLIKHETSHGAAGCFCEPEIDELRIDMSLPVPKVVSRVIVHQRLLDRKS